MLKVKDFDYDLWTTVEDGVKHYWAKVRETGEITEISHEVMVYLRSEEKRIYREIVMTRNEGTILSLDIPHDDEKESWFEDHGASKSPIKLCSEFSVKPAICDKYLWSNPGVFSDHPNRRRPTLDRLARKWYNAHPDGEADLNAYIRVILAVGSISKPFSRRSVKGDGG